MLVCSLEMEEELKNHWFAVAFVSKLGTVSDRPGRGQLGRGQGGERQGRAAGWGAGRGQAGGWLGNVCSAAGPLGSLFRLAPHLQQPCSTCCFTPPAGHHGAL